MKRALISIFIAAIAGGAGWYFGRQSQQSGSGNAAGPAERKVLFYQSSMHPWIKSEQPGNCTICGMKLSPVYEGEKGFGEGMDGVVTLGSNIIQVINVQSEEVRRRPLVRTLRVAGTIDDNDSTHRRLSAYADGRVERLFVNYLGAEVVAGQPLAVFYSPSLLAAESDYLTALRQGSEDISDALRTERRRLVEAAAQRLKRLGYSDGQIDALAKKGSADARTEILAPMTGTVTTRNVYEGQYVKEGDVLFEIADFSKMWFVFDAYERDLAWLRPGQMVEVSTPAVPGRTFRAPISFIDPNLNDLTRSARVRVELDNPIFEEDGRRARLLLHKMYAAGAVKIETPEVTAVPRRAVLAGGNEPVAYVDLGEGAYEARRLKLGRAGDDFWEVIEGLAPGDRVVTAGNFLIDSQAQLNAAVTDAASDPKHSSITNSDAAELEAAALNEAQLENVRNFLGAASAVARALAGDDLPGFNTAAQRLHPPMEKLVPLAQSVPSMRPIVAKLETTGHLTVAKSLDEARQQFVPFTMATAELAQRLRGHQPIAFKIYECPMVDRGVKGAPKRVRWVQSEAPLRNPFFGADMLECGVEVK